MSNPLDRSQKTKTIGPPIIDGAEAYNHEQGNALLLNQPDDEVIPVLLTGILVTDSTGQKELIKKIFIQKPALFQFGLNSVSEMIGTNTVLYTANNEFGSLRIVKSPTRMTSATGASPLTMIAAGPKHYAIYAMLIGSSAAGVVVIGDGATIINVQVAAGQSIFIPFGTPFGMQPDFIQPTNAAAITATLAAATLTTTIWTDDGNI